MRTFFLDVPFTPDRSELSYVNRFGAKYDAKLKRSVYVGSTLPPELKPYQSKDYSLLRWDEDEYNKKVLPAGKVNYRFTPRDHQKVAASKIAKAAGAGWRGFIEADDMGFGKTISCAVGAYGVAKVKKLSQPKVLVICPVRVIDHWADTFKALGITNFRMCITNFQQAKKLVETSKGANAKKASTRNKHLAQSGKPKVDWDIILIDESHYLKNGETSQISSLFENLAKYDAPASKAPFVIYISGTIGQNPVELGYLAPLVYQLEKIQKPYATWREYLEKHDYHIMSGKTLRWIAPKKDASIAEKQKIRVQQLKDLEKISKLLFGPNSPSIRRTVNDLPGWPRKNRVQFGVALDPIEKKQYDSLWLDFRKQRKLSLNSKNPKSGLVANLRFRQKASLLKAPLTTSVVLDLLENNVQVAVSCQFIESLDVIKKTLEAKNVPVVEYSGRNKKDNEVNRIAFQKGQAKVILFTAESSVSFHAGETLPDGSIASKKTRATVIHDPRYSGIASAQIENRCHRDGQKAVVYYIYLKQTTEAQVVSRLVQRMANTSTLQGDDEEFAEELENMLVGELAA